jgi:hypothetical protein
MNANKFEELETALIVECQRAMEQRDRFKETGVSTASHGGAFDTCFGFILRKFGINKAEPEVVPDTLLVDLFYAAQGDITQFRIKAQALLQAAQV